MPAANPTQIYVPVLKAFENGNTFTGSAGPLRFELSPLSETNEIRVRIWYGEYCLAKSEIAEEHSFPLSTEGLTALQGYLEALREAVD